MCVRVSVCACRACQSRLAGVRPNGRRSGAEQSAAGGCWLSGPGKGTGEPGGLPARALPAEGCPGRNAWGGGGGGGGGCPGRSGSPPAGGSRRSPVSAPSAPAGTLPLRLWQELFLPSFLRATAGDAFSCSQSFMPLIGSGVFLWLFSFRLFFLLESGKCRALHGLEMLWLSFCRLN